MIRVFTMRKVCPACRECFTITSAASVYCQNRDCKNRRRREDYAARKVPRAGSAAHLAQAVKSGA